MGNVILAFLKDLLIIDFVNEAADVNRVLECLGAVGGFFECALLGTREGRHVFVVDVDIVVVFSLAVLYLFLDLSRL